LLAGLGELGAQVGIEQLHEKLSLAHEPPFLESELDDAATDFAADLDRFVGHDAARQRDRLVERRGLDDDSPNGNRPGLGSTRTTRRRSRTWSLGHGYTGQGADEKERADGHGHHDRPDQYFFILHRANLRNVAITLCYNTLMSSYTKVWVSSVCVLFHPIASY